MTNSTDYALGSSSNTENNLGSGIMGNENIVQQKKCECSGYTLETVFLIVFVAICIVLSLMWIGFGFMDSKSGESGEAETS